MPLFGLRTTKKNEQSQIETSAGMAKSAITKEKKSTKTINNERTVTVTEKKKISMPKGSFSNETDPIIRPHITEKSGLMSEKGKYTFEVKKDANKDAVAKAIKTLYKVTPINIGIINIPSKNVFVRGKKGTVSGIKKAIVTVKKGDKIEFV